MTMTFINADDPRLLPETVEVPDNLVPEMRNVTYICEDLGVYIESYPDDWVDVPDDWLDQLGV